MSNQANSAQQEAIINTNGPVLITAGPGTGKTFTLVQRTIYLIKNCGVMPENIFIATFTEKAAKELITRISNELSRLNISANINDMYVGTFHAICLRLIKEFLDFTRIRKNYRVIDSFEQQYIIFQNFNSFKNIDGFNLLFPEIRQWHDSGKICAYVNKLSEELITPDMLINDKDIYISTLGRIFQEYNNLAAKNNILDFSAIMAETYKLLTQHPEILDKIRAKISHIMIDEYQDTNYIQERIIFLLAGNHENICVVGDDDQGLYRFRGATIRNILEFPRKFKHCKIIKLLVNYRSDKNIIDFYNKWMAATSGAKFKFEWDKFRFTKNIIPADDKNFLSNSVIKISADYDMDLQEKILDFILTLKSSGKLQDYNQIAFLFKSVKNPRALNLANFLESHGIRVYSPRSDMFFERTEIKLILGCLMLLFPQYVIKLNSGQFDFLSETQQKYFINCIELANKNLAQTENSQLRNFIGKIGLSHLNLTGTTDYSYSGLLYYLFGFKIFADILDTDMNSGVFDLRPARNLAKFTQIIGKFEFLHDINTLNSKSINTITENLFNIYIKLLYDGGITEYEDDSEYAPSGCVSFMTIHQAKGMEFPIVFVDSLYSVPSSQNDSLLSKIESSYLNRPEFEPKDDIKFFDFWRLYYTAFSRAQNLLILFSCVDSRTPSKYFREIYNSLPSVNNKNFCVDSFDFASIKDVNIKNKFSFTSHITVYETCSLQYKFYRELEFMPVRENAMLFGMLVHETIEDIHRAALRNESSSITQNNIESWLRVNYETLSRSTRSYLSNRQINIALSHVLNYADHQSGNWAFIQQAELDISLVKENYIIAGQIDLIRGINDSLEIVDFKSTRKPDINDPEARKQLELYRRQLHIYAHLVEQRTGQRVSKMNLYFTGEFDSVPTISFPYSPTAIQGTIESFDDTVKKILSKNFNGRASNDKICSNCDFRHYCKTRQEIYL